jgi:hemolysin D
VQSKLFLQRKGYFNASLDNYDPQIASLQAELQTNKSEEVLTAQQWRRCARSRRALRTDASGNRIKLNLLLSRASRLEVEDNLSHIAAIWSTLHTSWRRRARNARSSSRTMDAPPYRTSFDTLAKRNAAAEDLKKAELRQHMVVLTTPVDAIMLEIAHRSIGSMVREAETLFSLVPQHAPLQAEVSVGSKDIGEVAVGQPVRLKFDTFPFQKYGTASGVVRVISQDPFKPEGGEKRRVTLPSSKPIVQAIRFTGYW